MDNEQSPDDRTPGEIVADHVTEITDSISIAAYVSDHGDIIADVEHTTIAGQEVTISPDLTTEERDRVADAIQAVDPIIGQCFANALQVWSHDPTFNYVEGYAAAHDSMGIGFEHAWNSLNGKLVDITADFDAFWGATISDESVLSNYYKIGKEEDVWSIIGNHHDRFDFLRKRGYINETLP